MKQSAIVPKASVKLTLVYTYILVTLLTHGEQISVCKYLTVSVICQFAAVSTGRYSQYFIYI